MSNLRDYLDIIKLQSLSEDDQSNLAHMVLNNMDQDLEEWCQLHEISMDKVKDTVKRWARTGALAAALAGSGIVPAAAGQLPTNFNSPQVQQQQPNRQMDYEELKRRQMQQMQQRGGGQQNFNQQHGQDQQQHGQWHGNDADQMRGYRHMMQDPDRAARWAQERGGWRPHMEWHRTNPWAMINIEPPSQVLYFNDNGREIVFIPHPRTIDVMRAREMGADVVQLYVPNWPYPIRAFVLEQDDVTYITALPGQLP